MSVFFLLLGAVAGVLELARHAGARVAEDDARAATLAGARQASAAIRSYLARVAESVEIAARLNALGVLDPDQPEQLERFLSAQVAARHGLSAMYWGSSSGEFSFVLRERDGDTLAYFTKTIRGVGAARAVQLGRRDAALELREGRSDPNDPFHPLSRPWFQRALGTLGTVWTDPYVFYTSRQLGISVAQRVDCPNPEAACAFGADVALDDLTRLVEELGAVNGSSVVILTPDLRVLAGTGFGAVATPGSAVLPRIEELRQPVLVAAVAALRASGGPARDDIRLARFAHDGAEMLAGFAPIDSQGRGWMIGMTMPAFSLARWLDAWRASVLPMLAALVLVLAAGVVALWRWVGRDLRLIEAQMASAQDALPETAPRPGFAEFDRLSVQLEAMRKRLTSQGERMRKALHAARRADEAKAGFLAQISHELRTPLNAVIGFAELTQFRLSAPDPEVKGAREHVDTILVAARHLLDVIQQILDFTTRAQGEPALRETEVSADELLREAAMLAEPQAIARGIALHCEAEHGLALLCDRMQLREAVAELVVNAVKFSPRGTAVVSSARRSGNGVAISVADQGQGLTQAEVELALEPFGRVRRDPYIAGPPGLGLGLPLVRAIAEHHGGHLRIDAAAATGTTVTLELPSRRIARAPD